MMTLSKNEVNDKTDSVTDNCSADELTYEELYLKYQTLQNDKIKMLTIREYLLILNENNENISKRLLKVKTDTEFYKSHLYKTLFNLKVSTEKQKILSRKKLDEFLEKTQNFQEYNKMSPKKYELEELLKRNRHLQQEWENKNDLFELTKKQYIEFRNFIMRAFQNKVCEFCDVVLRLQQANN